MVRDASNSRGWGSTKCCSLIAPPIALQGANLQARHDQYTLLEGAGHTARITSLLPAWTGDLTAVTGSADRTIRWVQTSMPDLTVVQSQLMMGEH